MERISSLDREGVLENYCEDRVSPQSARRDLPNGHVNGDTVQRVKSTEKEPETDLQQNVSDVSGKNNKI